MSQTILYVVPLILGRTFNLDHLQVGVDIFARGQISEPVVIQNPITETHYKIVDSTKESRDLLDVSGSFRLNIKGGVFKAGASGAYLTDVYNRENTVEVVVRAIYQTVTETLPSTAKPVGRWQKMTGLGTHFVRSITYGGELIASVRLISNNTRDKQHIKASLEVGGRIEILDLGVEVEGEYLKDVSKSVDRMEIKVYSSVPLNKIAHNMEDLKEMIKQFPEDLKKYNEGKGVPLKVELYPLTYLDSTRPQYIKNKILDAHLEAFEEKFDDLLNTRTAISDWLKVMTQIPTEKQEKEIGKLYAEVQTVLRSFYDVIGKLDMSQSLNQLKPALDAYGKSLTGKYYHKYLILRQKMVKDQGEWSKNRGSGATYIHWGRSKCTNFAETVSSGNAAGPGVTGGGYNLLCLPKQPATGVMSSDDHVAILQGVTYKLSDNVESALMCATCRLAARGSATLFSGVSQCPPEWDLLYSGLLLTGSEDVSHISFICIEHNLEKKEIANSGSHLLVNWAIPANLTENEAKLVPCAMCAK